MKYKEFIENIIKIRGQWGFQNNEYYEGHHIIPKCLGGKGRSNKKDKNIIWLTPQEHYEAHRLLALENPDNLKLNQAWYCISHWSKSKKRKIKIDAEEYANLRKKIAENTHKKFLGKPAWNKGMKGIYSKETRLKMACRKGISPSNKGIPYSEEIKEKIRKARAKQATIVWKKESKEKLAKSMKKYYQETNIIRKNYIPIIDITTKVIYRSKKDCENKLGIGKKMLLKCLNKGCEWNGHIFKYYMEK